MQIRPIHRHCLMVLVNGPPLSQFPAVPGEGASATPKTEITQQFGAAQLESQLSFCVKMHAIYLLETDNPANDRAVLGDVVDKAVVRIVNAGATVAGSKRDPVIIVVADTAKYIPHEIA